MKNSKLVASAAMMMAAFVTTSALAERDESSRVLSIQEMLPQSSPVTQSVKGFGAKKGAKGIPSAQLVHTAGRGQSGMASWYALPGRRTACGPVHNPEAMTAAHRSLPCGTKVQVTNRANGMSVVVTINDRGPFVHGRVLDLSRGPARQIGMIGAGTAPVQFSVLN